MAKILITGGSGLLGKAVSQHLMANNHEVCWLSREAGEWQGIKKFYWDPSIGEIDLNAFDGIEHIIHLTGSGIVEKRWTKAYKQEILDSRVKSSALLFECIQNNRIQMKSFIGASAIGFYGLSESAQLYTEADEAAPDFLGQTCLQWENSYLPFKEALVRTVVIRIGIVLSKKAGFYKKVAPLYKWGLGTTFGKGSSYLSWIHPDDVARLFVYCLEHETIRGPINAVSSFPLSNTAFSKQLAQSINKPLFLPSIPQALLQLVLGDRMQVLVNGARVSNQKIKDLGFSFRYDDLQKTLVQLNAQ